MQHWAPNAMVPASSPGRMMYDNRIAENFGTGILIKRSPVFNEPCIAIGGFGTQFTIIRKDGDWYNMLFANSDKSIGQSIYNQTSDLGCIFNVNTQCDVTFDLSFDYKFSPYIKYTYDPGRPLWYDVNFNIPEIILINNMNQLVIDTHFPTQFRSITETNINYNKTLNLEPGIYSLIFAWNLPTGVNIGNVAVSYKNMKFSILSENVNNIKVTKNTWDIHRMLDNQSLYFNEYLRPDTIGANSVSRIVNNTATTVKFNDVRI
jgi:hypothetical protein